MKTYKIDDHTSVTAYLEPVGGRGRPRKLVAITRETARGRISIELSSSHARHMCDQIEALLENLKIED
jgi:hypothetical protein